MTKIGIFYHTDPMGNVASGIDSFIRGILRWAPEGLEYMLFGATSDPKARPVGREATVAIGKREVRYIPVIDIKASGARARLPLTVRYVWALRDLLQSEAIRSLDILDFHRVEALALFMNDQRFKNLTLHQDMSVIRNRSSDIKWRYAPAVYEFLERKLFGQVDTIFCVRQSAVERYRLTYPTMESRFQFVPTWYDSETFSPARNAEQRDHLRRKIGAAFSLPAARRILTFVGRLDRQKDPGLLLDSFGTVLHQSSDLHLFVIGDGPLRTNMEARIRSEGLSGHVTLLGALSRAEIADFLRVSDLFLLTSAYEGMPIAVLEALATGLPVVSTDVGEIRLVLQDGVNGWISRERTSEAVADAIVSALGSLAAISGRPCESSVEAFSAEKILTKIYRNHRSQAYGSQFSS